MIKKINIDEYSKQLLSLSDSSINYNIPVYEDISTITRRIYSRIMFVYNLYYNDNLNHLILNNELYFNLNEFFCIQPVIKKLVIHNVINIDVHDVYLTNDIGFNIWNRKNKLKEIFYDI